MDFFSLITTILIGVLCFIIYFGLSNFVLDFISHSKNHNLKYENLIRVIIYVPLGFISAVLISITWDYLTFKDITYKVSDRKKLD